MSIKQYGRHPISRFEYLQKQHKRNDSSVSIKELLSQDEVLNDLESREEEFSPLPKSGSDELGLMISN